MDGVRDSKGANLVPDHIIQLLLQLWCGLSALGQDHICVDALPLDVVVNPARSHILVRPLQIDTTPGTTSTTASAVCQASVAHLYQMMML